MSTIPGSSSHPEKAFFTNLDTQSVLHVQFNPRELRLDDRALWNPSEALGQTHPRLAYHRGAPSMLRMELVFDATDSGENVHQSYVQPLRGFLCAEVPAHGGGPRPPYVAFTWGAFVFEGVVEQVGTAYLMFASDGTPLRARVSLAIEQSARPGAPAAAGHPTLQAEVATYTTRSGDTLPLVAAACGVDARLIAVANDIEDPMVLEPGVALLIPANEPQAEALALQRRRANPGNWGAVEPVKGAPW